MTKTVEETVAGLRGMGAQDVIVRALVSEKTMIASQNNVYTFQVNPKANKKAIKYAVESLFDVTVVDVKTAMNRGKKKRQGFSTGKTADVKKAMVKVKDGDRIEVAGNPLFEY